MQRMESRLKQLASLAVLDRVWPGRVVATFLHLQSVGNPSLHDRRKTAALRCHEKCLSG